MSKKPEKPKIRKWPMSGALAQAIARHKAAQAAIDAHFGMIDDVALANQLFDAVFSAGRALRLEVECLEAEIRDLGFRWRARSAPRHPFDGGPDNA
jgi:hypothetical protein